MATQAQIDAARRNGAKSRGPVTPEGKQIAAQNAIKHGLLSKYTVVLNNERDEAFEEVLKLYFTHFAPTNPIEEDLVAEIATARWRLRRVWQLETSLIDQELADQALAFNAKNQHMIIESRRTAAAWKALATPDGPLALLNRYEARIRNSYTRSLRELLLLRGPGGLNCNPLPNEPRQAPSPSPATGSQKQPADSQDMLLPLDCSALASYPPHSSRAPEQLGDRSERVETSGVR